MKDILSNFSGFNRLIQREAGSGFTLLEVMIALAIIGATLTVSLYTVNYHADVSYDNSLKTRMMLHAKERLRLLELDQKESLGPVKGTDLFYKSSISRSAFEGIIVLKTVIKGDKKELSLSKLVVEKNGLQE